MVLDKLVRILLFVTIVMASPVSAETTTIRSVDNSGRGVLSDLRPPRLYQSDVNQTLFRVSYGGFNASLASRLTFNGSNCTCWLSFQVLNYTGSEITFADASQPRSGPGLYRVSLVFESGTSLDSDLTLEVLPDPLTTPVFTRQETPASSDANDHDNDSDYRRRLALGLGLGLGLFALLLLLGAAIALIVVLCLRRSRVRAKETAWVHNDKVVVEFMEKSKTLKTVDCIPAILQLMSNLQAEKQANEGTSVLGAFLGQRLTDISNGPSRQTDPGAQVDRERTGGSAPSQKGLDVSENLITSSEI